MASLMGKSLFISVLLCFGIKCLEAGVVGTSLGCGAGNNPEEKKAEIFISKVEKQYEENFEIRVLKRWNYETNMTEETEKEKTESEVNLIFSLLIWIFSERRTEKALSLLCIKVLLKYTSIFLTKFIKFYNFIYPKHALS